MPDPIVDLRSILEGRTSAANPRAAFVKIVNGLPAGQFIPVLQAAVRGVEPPVLDHLLIEVLHERVRSDTGFIKQLAADFLSQGADSDFWLVLLRTFDSMLKKTGQERARQSLMEKLAQASARPVRLRASAVRRMTLKPGADAARKLAAFLNSGEPWLINAAAHTVIDWHNDGTVPPELDLKPVYAYARQNPDTTVKLPAVLRLLAFAGDAEAQAVVEDLAQRVKGRDRARLINGAGEKLSPKTLAALVQSVSDDWDSRSERALEALFIEHPDRLEELTKVGLHRPYLQGLTLLPEPVKGGTLSRIRELRDAEPALAEDAARLLRRIDPASAGRITAANRRNLSPQADLIARMNEARIRVGNLHRVDSNRVAGGFNTGMHKADAVFVELGFGFNIAGQHWHSGVYLGFRPSRSGRDGSLAIAQAGRIGSTTTNVFDFDCIEIQETAASFESPETDVAETIETLHDNLMEGLREFNDDLEVQAPRRVPGMTAEVADRIAATAASFFDRGIDYTAFDMMNHKGLAWTGTVSDIQATRCDGVVEFSYEKNGMIVCRGLNSARRNISRRGVRFLENHNDLHLGSLDEGELCPRVQAGDQGDNDHQGQVNSSMTTAEGPQLPQVESFYVTPYFLFLPPMINFCVSAQRYNEVFVRITVSKDGGPFHFVTSDALGTEESIAATWRFEKVPTQRDISAFWLGRTAGGTDFRGQNGSYEFRLVAVDLGGNVSELRRAKVDIQWP